MTSSPPLLEPVGDGSVPGSGSPDRVVIMKDGTNPPFVIAAGTRAPTGADSFRNPIPVGVHLPLCHVTTDLGRKNDESLTSC